MEQGRHEHGMPCWVELYTGDPDGAKAFYGDVMRWEYQDHPTPGVEPGIYTTVRLDGGDVGGLCPLTGVQRGLGLPPHLLVYFAVDDVDEVCRRAPGLGGAVVMEPIDVPSTGRMAMLRGPGGELFCLWDRHANHRGFGRHEGRHGSVVWCELLTGDVDRSGSFYTRLLGWDPQPEQASGGRYVVFAAGDEPAAGMIEVEPELVGASTAWTTYLAVDDCAASCERVGELGGEVLSPLMPVEGVGTYALVRDPQGAVLGLLQPLRA